MLRPPSIFYTRQKRRSFDAAHLERIERYREFADMFGLAPICFVRSCRRAGRCAGDPQQGRFYLPPCFGHYREEIRFLASRLGGIEDPLLATGRLPRHDAEPAPAASETQKNEPLPHGSTVLGALYGTAPETLKRLRRPAHVPGPGGWERDPEGFFASMAKGDWRNPEKVCARPPVKMGDRWVD